MLVDAAPITAPAGTVWMIIPTYHPVVGGAQSQVTRLSLSLLEQGWTVQVLTRQHSYAHPEGLPRTDSVAGLPVRRVYSRGSSKTGALLFVLGGLWHLLSAGRGHIYHAHDVGASGWLAVLAATLTGGRSLVKLRTGASAYRQYLASRLARWQFQALLRLTDYVVVVNREVEQLLAELSIPAERVVRLPNAVNMEEFRPPSADERKASRDAIGLSPDETVVLYVGRLEQLKGVDILLAAWAELLAAMRLQARLIIVGEGPEKPALTRQALAAGLDGTVVFTGERHNVLDYYWAADLFVLPSRTEGLSNALLEAMACALPVIASNVGGAPDLVRERQSGLLFESEDVMDLAQKLTGLLVDKALQQRLATAGRQRVAAYASLPVIARQLRVVYDAGDGS